MNINLTGDLWGTPFDLIGQIEIRKPEQLSISLIDQLSLIDTLLIFCSILFIFYVLKYRDIPLFGGFWYYQKTLPLHDHEGERFIFKKMNGKLIEYKPTHDRAFWKRYLQIYDVILSPLRKDIQSQEKLSNWMLAVSGGALILVASNFDKFQMTERIINLENMPLYVIPDKLLFLFILLNLFISTSLHFSSKLHLYYIEGDLENALVYIPLSEGVEDLNEAINKINELMASLKSMTEAYIPPEYSNLVSRFENMEKNLDIRRANTWRRFQIGNAFFIVSLFSLIIFYILYIFNI